MFRRDLIPVLLDKKMSLSEIARTIGEKPKDVIDAQVSVESLDLSASVERAFAAAGYPVREAPAMTTFPLVLLTFGKNR